MFRYTERDSSTKQQPFPYSVKVRSSSLLLALALLSVLTLALSACSLYTVRPIQSGSTGQYNQFNQQFDPTSYVSSIWSSKVIPTIVTKSVDLTTLLAALQTNTSAAEKQYAAPSSDGSFNFMVKGQGTITTVNTTSRVGTVTLHISGVSSQTTLVLQIGPVISGTALRDSVGFITFTNFDNQVQFAEVSDQLNARAATALQAIPFATLKGQSITFYGAFTLLDPHFLSIVPVKIISGGGQ